MWQEAQGMITLYRTDDRILSEIQEYGPGAWIVMTKPTIDESKSIAERFEIDLADVRAALDDEESSRVQVEDNYTLIIVDIPSIEIRNEREAYTTIPLGIILVADCIITICAEETPVLEAFMEGKVREFSTKKRMRFMYQILYRNCTTYQYYLRVMDRRRTLIEQRIQEETEDADLIDLHELESNLVYFATSLRANGVVLDKLTRYGRIKQYPEDKELLDDVLVENKQAIEMTQIYRYHKWYERAHDDHHQQQTEQRHEVSGGHNHRHGCAYSYIRCVWNECGHEVDAICECTIWI